MVNSRILKCGHVFRTDCKETALAYGNRCPVCKEPQGLMLLWFADLMNVTEEVTIHRPNVSTLLSGAFIRGDLNAATRGPFI